MEKEMCDLPSENFGPINNKQIPEIVAVLSTATTNPRTSETWEDIWKNKKVVTTVSMYVTFQQLSL